jgi:uncharacterized protein with von Willebrand factor type A (vWA) domain
MQPGDTYGGTLADNLTGFGRSLRRAGIAVDSARMALATEAVLLVGMGRRDDVGAALEAVMVSCEQDRQVFREMFDSYFRDPAVANNPLAQTLPGAESRAEPAKGRPRVREALAPQRDAARMAPPQPDSEVDADAAMTASNLARLRHADFNGLSASEYHLVERLARDIRMPMPEFATRRVRPGSRGARLHWPGVMRHAARTGGEVLRLPRMQRQRQPLPLLVLVDVSGSMERYARLLLAFLHAATRQVRQRDVFAFGTRLTDLGAAMRLGDTDEMLAAAGVAIEDFAGGTQLGDSLASLRRHHARRLVGRRTVVLVITDGLDTGEPQDLMRELDWLCRHSHRLLWLNPLLRFDGYAPLARGAAALHARAHGMVAVHNLEKLEDLAKSLAALMAR